MRFAHRLSAHLTPEWRDYYVDYDGLKKRVYEMTDLKRLRTNEQDTASLIDNELFVDTDLQTDFFDEMEHQLDKVNAFYVSREEELNRQLSKIEEEISILVILRANNRTRNLRSTKRKRDSLKRFLCEFYLAVAHLQYYQTMNHTGFRKILKKQDKLARTTRGKQFFTGRVCKAYFWTSKVVPQLIEKTENLMIDKLEDGNRSKAMDTLRLPPMEERDVRSHWATLRAGWYMGLMFVMIVVLIIAFVFRPLSSWNHVTPVVRGLRAGLILTLWFYAFAVNNVGWKFAGVNQVLIFDIELRDYRNYVQLFEIASLLGVIVLLGGLLTVFSYWLGYPEWVGPLVMFGLIVVLFVLPIPLPPLYHTSRIWLAKELVRISVAPLFEVTFPDFWIADQLNSLVVVLLDIEYFWCFLLVGIHFPDAAIQCGTVRYGLRPIVAVLPAWFRFAQCLRRYYSTRKAFPHLVNAGKYSTSFFVVFFSSLGSGLRDPNSEVQNAGYYITFVLWVVSAIVSTCYTFTWDVKMDWGLFEGKYKLRKELIYKYKIYYILAVIEDLIFRALWTLNISVGEAGASILEGNILGTVLGILEVFRRFIWNFFRLENEHLNNCGEFRVVRPMTIHQFDPNDLQGHDDEIGAEPVMREHLRRLSDTGNVTIDSSSLRQRRKGGETFVPKVQVIPESPTDPPDPPGSECSGSEDSGEGGSSVLTVEGSIQGVTESTV